MTDILLIQPPVQDFFLTAKRTIPYGLASLAAVLRNAGFSVRILDAHSRAKSRKISVPAELSYLEGYYSPSTGELDANMVDGVVSVYEVIEIYFEGDLVGQLQPEGHFEGTWDGEALGTNQAFITGTAVGDGIWTAEEVVP